MNYNPFSLEGKTVLVTGASSGIGREIAVDCSKMGADVVITARNEERLKETLQMMEGEGNSYVVADLTDEEAIKNLVDKLPALHGVVHNAGAGNRVLCKAVKERDIDNIIAPNVKGPMLLQRHLLKQKKILSEGSIVFIASRAPYAPSVGNAIYSASKGAILGYAQVLALEVAPKKIRVNSVLPAMVWTELVAKDAELMGVDYSELQKKYPLQRYGKPEDVAHLVIYLLSDASSWMTGSAIDLTGGAKEL
ncbi:MAG: SDR family oxidoreductase [Bacteroidaceae bacterium]|nr:SDR family oxidoreductase [Bacteroidaceae bacterium]